jgi:hypothetical protein
MEEMHHAVMAILGAGAGFAFSCMVIGTETQQHLRNTRQEAFVAKIHKSDGTQGGAQGGAQGGRADDHTGYTGGQAGRQ